MNFDSTIDAYVFFAVLAMSFITEVAEIWHSSNPERARVLGQSVLAAMTLALLLSNEVLVAIIVTIVVMRISNLASGWVYDWLVDQGSRLLGALYAAECLEDEELTVRRLIEALACYRDLRSPESRRDDGTTESDW